MKNLAEFLLGSHRRLNNIIRFNTRIKTYEESVAAHSFFVTLYVYIVGMYLKLSGEEINFKHLLLKALLHDLEECISGDILTPFKKLLEEEYNKLSELSLNEMIKDLHPDIKDSIIQYWQSSNLDFEGFIVDFCDNLAGYIYCQEQIKTGNTYFKDISEDYKSRLIKQSKQYSILEELIKELIIKETK